VDWEKVGRYVDMEVKLQDFSNPNKERKRSIRNWYWLRKSSKANGLEQGSDLEGWVPHFLLLDDV